MFDLFSKRMKRQRGDVPDVYVYDRLPKPLRVQIVQIWRDALGDDASLDPTGRRRSVETYLEIAKVLRKEHHRFALNDWAGAGRFETEVAEYFMSLEDAELALDVVHAVFAYVEHFGKSYYQQYGGPPQAPSDAITELNARFKEHGVGYQFESGQIVRVDSNVLHAEVVKPALALLREKGFEGPNEEFLRAHEHHRHGRQEECVADCLKAFESTMKVICARRTLAHDKNAAAKALIETCIKNGLVPAYQTDNFRGFVDTMMTLPTVSNKNAGHGAGDTPRQVPGYLAAYALHLTAANIVMMVEAHKANPAK